MTRIGVLALQGAFIEHEKMLRSLGVEAVEVRLPEQLQTVDGLIIPGGESTTIGKLATTYGLIEPLRSLVKQGTPVWGTCAGMILLADDIGGLQQPLIGGMDVEVSRNAFGRQVDSFEEDLAVPELDKLSPEQNRRPFRAVFIRAPLIKKVGNGVEVLARLPDNTVVAARQRRLMVTSFHPELTDDPRFHRYFLSMVEEAKARKATAKGTANRQPKAA